MNTWLKQVGIVMMIGLGINQKVLAGGNPKLHSSVVFYTETQVQSNPKMIMTVPIDGKKVVFDRMPDFGTRDIECFKVFVNGDGQGYGLVLTLKEGAKRRLGALSSANRGKILLARVNGRDVDYVVMDQPIADGKLVIWKNVGDDDLSLLDQDFRRAGEKKPRGKQKKK